MLARVVWSVGRTGNISARPPVLVLAVGRSGRHESPLDPQADYGRGSGGLVCHGLGKPCVPVMAGPEHRMTASPILIEPRVGKVLNPKLTKTQPRVFPGRRVSPRGSKTRRHHCQRRLALSGPWGVCGSVPVAPGLLCQSWQARESMINGSETNHHRSQSMARSPCNGRATRSPRAATDHDHAA